MSYLQTTQCLPEACAWARVSFILVGGTPTTHNSLGGLGGGLCCCCDGGGGGGCCCCPCLAAMTLDLGCHDGVEFAALLSPMPLLLW